MPRVHQLRVHPSAQVPPRDAQLAWRIAEVAADPVAVTAAVAEMIANRIIDDAATAAAALRRRPVVNARAQALAHPASPGATVLGEPLSATVSAEWAAWANGVAVRELDFHDTFLAAEYAHPGDTIPPLVAVAQHRGATGAALVRAVATAYEIHVGLARGICLHEHRIDHIAHLGPAVAAGLGTLLDLPCDVTFAAVGHALHVTTTTRQSRKGEISSWKAYAPAFAGKMAVEAVDRAMRGETSPAPIYEGADGVVAWLLDGPDARYEVPLPAPGEAKTAILDTYTKAHAAEYQAQALIDLAFRLRGRIGDLGRVADIEVRTSHHTHAVIGTGADDPAKLEPTASRETLDHSISYILAVALEDGTWHHERSYAPERAGRPSTVALWHKIHTVEDPGWTRRYHDPDPRRRAFGGRLVVTLEDGTVVTDELAVADAHPLGAHPFGPGDYDAKLRTLSVGIVAGAEADRFVSLARRVTELGPAEVRQLSFAAVEGALGDETAGKGLF